MSRCCPLLMNAVKSLRIKPIANDNGGTRAFMPRTFSSCAPFAAGVRYDANSPFRTARCAL
jgi:hypothetical protein